MTSFDAFTAMAFSADSPFSHPTFVDLSSILYVSILSKWMPRYLRLFAHSMTSPLKETAGIACPTALLLRVHHRACALLGLISDPISWHYYDTFSSCSRPAVTTAWASLAVL